MSFKFAGRCVCALAGVLAVLHSGGCASAPSPIKSMPLFAQRRAAETGQIVQSPPKAPTQAPTNTPAPASIAPPGGIMQAQYMAPAKSVGHSGCKPGGG